MRTISKTDFPGLVVEALREHDGACDLALVAKYIWDNYEAELRASGRIFYTWQYDARWAADKLRRRGIMKAAKESPRGIWELA